jgi:hypothetical protein
VLSTPPQVPDQAKVLTRGFAGVKVGRILMEGGGIGEYGVQDLVGEERDGHRRRIDRCHQNGTILRSKFRRQISTTATLTNFDL